MAAALLAAIQPSLAQDMPDAANAPMVLAAASNHWAKLAQYTARATPTRTKPPPIGDDRGEAARAIRQAPQQ